MLRKLLEVTEVEPGQPEPAFLDFSGVDAATSSFLRESVLGYRDALRMRRSRLYPVISNADEGVEEELDYLGSGGLCDSQRVAFTFVGSDTHHAPERRPSLRHRGAGQAPT